MCCIDHPEDNMKNTFIIQVLTDGAHCPSPSISISDRLAWPLAEYH